MLSSAGEDGTDGLGTVPAVLQILGTNGRGRPSDGTVDNYVYREKPYSVKPSITTGARSRVPVPEVGLLSACWQARPMGATSHRAKSDANTFNFERNRGGEKRGGGQ